MQVSRRQFCVTLGAAGLSALTVFAEEQRPQPLRVIAYNIYAGKGWPSDRPLAKKAVKNGQMARRLAMELALHDPDIINFSESPSEAVTQEIADILKMNHVRFPSGKNWPGTLLSKFEVVASENVPLGYERPPELFTRHWGRAIIKLPHGEPLIVHSAHLFPPSQKDSDIRLEEIRTMLTSMKGDFEAGRSMLLIGDLNHTPETQDYRLWMDAGWVDTFMKAGQGNGLTFKADAPEHRIDYIMASGPIASRLVESRPLSEGAFRLNVADENAFSLSDHLPQLAVFNSK